MDVSQLKQYLPKEFESRQQRDARYIHAVICVYLLTVIQPEYKNITYQEFVDDFEKYIDLTNFKDNPCLKYQRGANEGKLKMPNKTTFANTWVPRYNVNGLLEDFKDKVTTHIAKTTLRDVVLTVPNRIEKNNETFNKAHDKQDILFEDTYEDGKKPYQIKAYQETKNSAENSINDSVEMLQDYLNALQQQANQSEVYKPNHDRIIDKYHNLENEWEED